MTTTHERSGGELFVEALEQYGVTRVFGNPGTTELPVVKALGESEIEYTLALHEDIAVGMAAGYTSVHRQQSTRDEPTLPLGVVNLHTVAGAAHGLANVYGAQHLDVPLLITAGGHSTAVRHDEPILHGDTVSLLREFTKWSDEVPQIDALPAMLRRAVERALTPPTGPVFLSLPLDVMMETTDATPQPLSQIPTAGEPASDRLAMAADRLEQASSPVLVLGDGVAHGGTSTVEAAITFAEQIGARVVGEILTAEIPFPTTHEQWAGFVPPGGPEATALLSGDVIIAAGTSSNTLANSGVLTLDDDLLPKGATLIELSDDPRELGKHRPADVTILGDIEHGLVGLTERLSDRISDATREQRIEDIQTRHSPGDEPAEDQHGDAITVTTLVQALNTAAPDAIVIDESLTSSRALRTQRDYNPGSYYLNKGGGLGFGLPAAVGAAIAEAQRSNPRSVIGFIGDGSYLYYPQALYTAAREAVDLTVIVPDNRGYRILRENMERLFDESELRPDSYTGMDFDPALDIPLIAQGCGSHGRQVTSPSKLVDAVQTAVTESGPTVLDVVVGE